MGNTNVTASYPEAVAKFSKTELAGLGSTFRKMTTAQVAGGSGAPRSAGASTGQLTFREFYRSLKKYYQVDLACGLFRVAVELSSQAHLAQMPAFTRHQTLTRTEASATASLSSTTEGAASSREPPTDGVDCAIGRAKALRVQSLIAELEGVTCDYEGIVRMLAMTCRFAETEYAVQVLLQGFAPQATQQRFTRETLHMVVAALCTSAAGTLGLDLLSEKAAEQPLTTEEIDLGVNAMVTRAFTGITKLTLTFEQTCRFFNGERQLLAYLKYGLQYLYFVFDKKDDPENSRIPYPAELSLRRIPLPPKLLRIRGKTLLDDPADAAAVTSWLPGYLRDASLVHLYSSNEDGFAASTLIFLCGRKDRNLVKDPLLLLVQDYEDNVFGFFSPVPLHPHGNNKFYGTKAVFLFKLRPGSPKRYAATLRDENFLFTTAEGGIGVGGDRGYHGLFLDNEFYFGYFRRTETFLNEEVSETSAFKFQCKHVEAWAFIQNDRLEFFNPEPAEEDDDGLEPLRTDVSKKSILNQAGGAFLLEMMNAGSAAAQAASHA